MKLELKPVLRRRIVEELCQDDACPREGTHWHRLSVGSLLREACGEYTITIRVRMAKASDKPRRRGRPLKETIDQLKERVAREAEDVADRAGRRSR